MLSSPRKPSSTIRILSSAEKCRRVARRMSFTTCSAGFLALEDLGFILVPSSADETKTLLNSQPQIWDTGADGEQLGVLYHVIAAPHGQDSTSAHRCCGQVVTNPTSHQA